MRLSGKVAVLFIIVGVLPVFGKIQQKTGVADDRYAPLGLYDGKWDYTTTIGEKESIHLENHCTKTGLFFACEQMVNGKTAALIVFLPVARMASGGEEYGITGLSADANPPADWNKLTIEAERWVYSWEDTDGGKKVFWRNVNQFSGPSKIHFEIHHFTFNLLEETHANASRCVFRCSAVAGRDRGDVVVARCRRSDNGTGELNVEKSKFVPEPGPRSQTVTIKIENGTETYSAEGTDVAGSPSGDGSPPRRTERTLPLPETRTATPSNLASKEPFPRHCKRELHCPWDVNASSL